MRLPVLSLGHGMCGSGYDADKVAMSTTFATELWCRCAQRLWVHEPDSGKSSPFIIEISVSVEARL